jgi:nitroreductase
MTAKNLIGTLVIVSLSAVYGIAQDITLPNPQKTGGKPLVDAISQRQTSREFSSGDLDMQTVSDLLWAAYGFNREDRRVIPTALNKQELSVYVFLKSGIYLYDAKDNKLLLKVAGDQRKLAGTQPFVPAAPLSLVYVGDTDKVDSGHSFFSSGCASQNVSLVAASKGLACGVRASIDHDALSKALKLTGKQVILMGQSVGKPK